MKKKKFEKIYLEECVIWKFIGKNLVELKSSEDK